MNGRPPVIIIGMHRSGTSLVSRALEQLGLFIGWRKDKNNEATLFMELNEWLLREAGASWEHPEPERDLIICEPVRTQAVRYCKDVLRSAQSLSYLGPASWVRYGNVFHQPYRWGWKDPRNTFTLPLWLDLFPEAKFIHVVRHGVDVAASLRARSMASLAINKTWKPAPNAMKRFARYWKRPISKSFVDGVRSLNLDSGLELWATYVAEARRHMAAYDGLAMEISYEWLLEQPHHALHKLSEFCELKAEPLCIKTLVQSLDERRAFAFRRNPELCAFAETRRDELTAWEYSVL